MNRLTEFVLQAITPSWKFFDDVGHIPKLSVRTVEHAEWSEWFPRYKRGPAEFFVNPEGNLELAKVTLIERFVSELATVDEVSPAIFTASMPYQLVEAFARELIRANQPDATRFQFQIEIVDQAAPTTRETVFVSAELEV